MSPSPEETIDLIAAEQPATGGSPDLSPRAGGGEEGPEASGGGGVFERLLSPAPRKPVEFSEDQLAIRVNETLGDETEPPGILGECGVGESIMCTVNALTGRGGGNLPPLVYLVVAVGRWILDRGFDQDAGGGGGGGGDGGGHSGMPVVPDPSKIPRPDPTDPNVVPG